VPRAIARRALATRLERRRRRATTSRDNADATRPGRGRRRRDLTERHEEPQQTRRRAAPTSGGAAVVSRHNPRSFLDRYLRPCASPCAPIAYTRSRLADSDEGSADSRGDTRAPHIGPRRAAAQVRAALAWICKREELLARGEPTPSERPSLQEGRAAAALWLRGVRPALWPERRWSLFFANIWFLAISRCAALRFELDRREATDATRMVICIGRGSDGALLFTALPCSRNSNAADCNIVGVRSSTRTEHATPSLCAFHSI